MVSTDSSSEMSSSSSLSSSSPSSSLTCESEATSSSEMAASEASSGGAVEEASGCCWERVSSSTSLSVMVKVNGLVGFGGVWGVRRGAAVFCFLAGRL